MSAAAGGWNQINRARILSGLRNVLGVEAREVTFRAWPPGGPFGTLRIPEPWSRFFQIQVALSTEPGGGASSCGAPFNIQLKPVFAALLLVSDQDWATFAAGASAEDKRRVLIVSSTGQEDGGQKVVIFQQARSDGGATPEMWGPDEAEKAFAESLTGPEISRLRERADRGLACVIPTAQGEGCALRAETYVVHASQYDFVRAIAKSVPYSYAVFPRGDVEGVINDRELAAGLQAGEGSKLGLSGLQIDREVGAEPVVVNFAGGRSEAVVSGAFDFGWAIVRPGRQRPSQVSQLVLVSVPAYLDTLVLWVETGWLDRDVESDRAAAAAARSRRDTAPRGRGTAAPRANDGCAAAGLRGDRHAGGGRHPPAGAGDRRPLLRRPRPGGARLPRRRHPDSRRAAVAVDLGDARRADRQQDHRAPRHARHRRDLRVGGPAARREARERKYGDGGGLDQRGAGRRAGAGRDPGAGRRDLGRLPAGCGQGMTRPPAPSGQVQGLPIGWAEGRTQTPCDVWQ